MGGVMSPEGLFKEDAERLARQIEDENPMVDILEIKVDPEQGGYVIVAYDRGADEEFLVDRYETWTERASTVGPRAHPQVVVRVKEKRGKKTAVVRGEWEEVEPDDWSEDICDAVEQRELPGESLLDIEPTAGEADLVEPGHGAPGEYGFDGTFLVHLSSEGARVWRQILRLANFTLEDQSGLQSDWRSLGFDISPEPLAPFVEPGAEEWGEADVLEEVRDRLLDISEQGFGAILVDGQTNAMAYAWVLAGRMGLKVITSWTREEKTAKGGFSGLGYSELIHYRDVETSL
jgi:hypothetical protein